MRLAGPRRPHPQRALGDLAAQFRKAARIAQELDDFFQLLARLVNAGHISKGHAPLLFGQHLGLALAKAHGAAAAALLHLAHGEETHRDNQQEGQRLKQDIEQDVRLIRRLALIFHVILGQQGRQRDVVGNGNRGIGLAILELAGDALFAHLRVIDAALGDLGAEFGIGDRLRAYIIARAEQRYGEEQGEEDPPPYQKALRPGVSIGLAAGLNRKLAGISFINGMFRAPVGTRGTDRPVAVKIPRSLALQPAPGHEIAEIGNGQVVDVGRFIPGHRQQARHRHPPAPQQIAAHPPMGEIGKGNKGPPPDAQQFLHHLVGPLGGLQRLAQDRIIETGIGIERQNGIRIALNRRQPLRHAACHIMRVQLQPARIASAFIAQRRHQRAIAAADIQHLCPRRHMAGNHRQIGAQR
ncbi:hypothetical protein E4T56_gene17928, partial [Termitomyces sp. T112]